jgi:hypothetical protein
LFWSADEAKDYAAAHAVARATTEQIKNRIGIGQHIFVPARKPYLTTIANLTERDKSAIDLAR